MWIFNVRVKQADGVSVGFTFLMSQGFISFPSSNTFSSMGGTGYGNTEGHKTPWLTPPWLTHGEGCDALMWKAQGGKSWRPSCICHCCTNIQHKIILLAALSFVTMLHPSHVCPVQSLIGLYFCKDAHLPDNKQYSCSIDIHSHHQWEEVWPLDVG